MLYQIEATSIWSHRGEVDKLLEKFPCLKDFGYRKLSREVRTGEWIRDENNKKIWQAGITRIVYDPYIELNTLEDLDRFMKAVEEPLVLSPGTIEIYDTYRE